MVFTNADITFLKKTFPFFEDVLLEAMLKAGEERIYAKDQALVVQGKHFWNTSLVLSGMVSMQTAGENNASCVIGYLRAGDCFAGAISDNTAVADRKAGASYTAMELTHVLHISFEDKDALAAKFPHWYQYLLRSHLKHLRLQEDILQRIAFLQLEQRVSYFLMRLSKVKQQSIVEITHQEIAAGINASREAVSRTLKKMERLGKIKMMHNEISITPAFL